MYSVVLVGCMVLKFQCRATFEIFLKVVLSVETMNFSQFLLILHARFRIIMLVLVVTVVATFTVSLLLPKTYQTATTLVLNYKGLDPVTGLTLPSQLMPGYMATQMDIINSMNVAR